MCRWLPLHIMALVLASALMPLSAAWGQTYEVKSNQKIADNTGGFNGTLTNDDEFGSSVANVGDLDNDGVEDLAVGAQSDDTGGPSRGAAYVLFMNSNGTVKSHQKVADNTGGFNVTLVNSDAFGSSVANVGDLDNDGIEDLFIGAPGDDTGGNNRGAAYVLLMNSNGTVKSNQKIADNTGGFNVTLTDFDSFGKWVTGLGDLDNDGVEDLAVGSFGDDTGGNGRGAVYVLFMNSNGTVKSHQKIADNTGGFNVTLTDNDAFGRSLAGLGDLDGDGIEDLAVGSFSDDTGGTGRGAVYVLLMNSNGTVKSNQKIADNTGGFNVTLTDNDFFSASVASLGDLDGDGVGDLAVGAQGDDTGGSGRGAVYVLLMNSNGTVKSHQKIADNTGGFNVTLTENDLFGFAAAGLGDLNGDGSRDLVVGALGDDTGGSGRGAVYVLFTGVVADSDGSLTAAATISEPVALPTTATASGSAVSIFDFTLTDGGTSDGQTLDISQINLAVSGTGTASKLSFLLSGPDASDVAGSLSGSTLSFSSLSISVANNSNETYTVKAYYNDNTSLTENQTFILTIDGDTDLTVSSSKTQMSGSNAAVANSTGSTVAVTATQLSLTTQPAPLSLTSGTQLDFTTDPVVTAQDAAGNTDVDFSSSVTLAENGSGSSSFSNHTVTAVNGVATFSGLLLTYTATADQQTLGLTAWASGVTSATSSNLTADVVATRLAFTTQPSPLSLTSGTQLDFTTDPVVTAQDANGVTDTGFSSAVTLAENGSGSSSFSNHTATAVNGVATFSGVLLTYTATADQQTFGLTASATGVTGATSNNLTADIAATQLVFTTQPAPLSLTSGTQLDFSTDPIVTAQDANGVTDTGFSGTVTLAENGAGSGSLSNHTAPAVNGVATFSGLSLTYTATADQESLGLTASASGAASATSSSLTADVVATRLAFTTQPAPLELTSGTQLDFTTDPVVTAQDADGTTDTGFASTITLATSGADAATFSNHSATPVNGVATFSGLSLTYNATSANSITLSATASGVTAAASSSFAVTAFPLLAINRGGRLGEGGTLALDNSLLKFTDSASTASQVVYTLSSIPAVGQLELSGSALAAGGTFSQDDLDNSRLSYTHLGGDEVFADGFSFTVKGSPGVATSAFRFDLAIDAGNDQPRLDVLQTLRLQEGETITITNGNLRALDGDHLGKELALTLVESPQHGQLNMGAFTQADIDDRQLTYRHDGSETTADRFVFTVTDAEGSARTNIGIDFQITPVNDAPVLPVLSEQQATEGQAFTLAVAISDPESDAFTTALTGLPEGAIFADGTLHWTPSFADAGRYGVTLTATDAHGAAGSRRFDLTVTDAGAPDLALAAVDFGAVDAGQTVERTLTISNPTDLPLVIAPVAEAPADNRVFTMILPPSPLTVPPRQQAELKVSFSPRRDTPAKRTATLVCPTNLGPITVPVAGTSRWSQLELSAQMLDFGAVPVGGTKRLHVEAHNPGTAPLVVEGITCTVEGFAASPTRFTLAPGARRALTLTYEPTRQTRTAGLVRLQVQDQPSQVIAVQGLGRAAPEGFVHLDFDLGAEDQGQRRRGAVQPGDLVDVQLVIEDAPAIDGWAARVAYDPQQLSYVAGSFAPSDLVADLQGLADDTQPGLLEVGGAVLSHSVAGLQAEARRGVLGTLRFRVEAGFHDAADLAVTRVRLRRVDHDGLVVAAVRSVATLSAAADGHRFRPDFDDSGLIDFDDFFLFADAFGRAVPTVAARFDLDDSGQVDFGDFFLFADVFGQTAPAGKRAAQPLATALQPGYPNPFNAETTLTYALAAPGLVELAIYNLAGQRVQTLAAGQRSAGRHTLVWDGRDDRGQAVASGRYFVRLQAEHAMQVRGLTLLK